MLQVGEVVSSERQTQIVAAWRAEGCANHLGPIKQRLPEEIECGEIRCVLAAQQRARSSRDALKGMRPHVAR